MNEDLIKETGERNSKGQTLKDNLAIVDKVMDLKNKGLSVRQIEAEIKRH
jgi:hypothetical protein